MSYVRVWHDNSGCGAKASWYLKSIIVHDLTKDKKYCFVCDDWLAVERSDSRLDRVLSVADETKELEFAYLMKKKTKKNFSDEHLWLSVFARPVQSSFSRVERVASCFVLLFVSMLFNIFYYDTTASTKTNAALTIGPFYLSQEQIVIGFITNLVVFVPTFIVIQLFRRSRRRVPRSRKVREAFKNQVAQTCDLKSQDLQK